MQPVDFDTKYIPTAQSPADWQSGESCMVEYIQSGHATHTEFATCVHAELTYWPGAQTKHSRGAVSPVVLQ